MGGSEMVRFLDEAPHTLSEDYKYGCDRDHLALKKETMTWPKKQKKLFAILKMKNL